MSLKRGRKKRSDLGDIESVRKELEQRYVKTFGCSPGQAPWGAPWQQVFEQAKTADEAYDRAEQVLTNLRRALSEVQDFVRSYAPADRAPTIDDCVGMTGPEGVLFAGFSLDHAPLAAAMNLVSWAEDFYVLRRFFDETTRKSDGVNGERPVPRREFSAFLPNEMRAAVKEFFLLAGWLKISGEYEKGKSARKFMLAEGLWPMIPGEDVLFVPEP